MVQDNEFDRDHFAARKREAIHKDADRVAGSWNVKRIFPDVKFVGDGVLLRGLGSLQMMVDLIGDGERTDHDLASLLVENEQDVRELLKFAGEQLFAMMKSRSSVAQPNS